MYKFYVFTSLLVLSSSYVYNVTNINNEEICPKILNRKRRLLAFPEDSHFVITISLLKTMPFEKTVNTLHEIDVALPLPKSLYPPQLFHMRKEKTDIFNQIEALIDMLGYNGKFCLQRLVCEVMFLKDDFVNNSIVLQILVIILRLPQYEANSKQKLNKLKKIIENLRNNKCINKYMGALIENCEETARIKLFTKLGITEDSLKADVEYLINWMDKQPHLPRMDHVNLKEWVSNQLIMAKNSLEKTKYSIDRYCSARTMCPELFINRDILNNQILSQSFENLTISYPPGLTPRLHKVSIVRIESPDSEQFNFEAHMKRCLMVMEYYLKEGLDFTGFHIVFDLENFRLSHLGKFNIALMKYMSIAMKAYPVSFAVINLINYPTFVEKAIAIFKPFISEKLLSRIILMKGTDELRKVIGNVSLPVDYNGTAMPQKECSDLMKQNLINIREYILKCDSIKCNDSLRNDDKFKCYQEMDDGVAGSFRKLCID